ncbi:MAG: methyltransferase family protein [Pseudomonadota bacterium]
MNVVHRAHGTRRGRGGAWVVGQVVLIAAILLSAFLGRGWPARVEPVAVAIGGLLLALGIGGLAVGAARLGAALTPFPAPRADAPLRTDGVYGLVRHPMYGGGILIALGWTIVFATVPGLVLTIVLGAFVELKARREERWLEERHPEYAEYRRRTPHRFVPFVW